jgi:hypothetical protein
MGRAVEGGREAHRLQPGLVLGCYGGMGNMALEVLLFHHHAVRCWWLHGQSHGYPETLTTGGRV